MNFEVSVTELKLEYSITTTLWFGNLIELALTTQTFTLWVVIG